jgi:hypothetical protein
MALPLLQIPDALNYIGVFLTLECNLNCSYCINDPEQLGRRSSLFPIESKTSKKSLTPAEWATALLRIPFRKDLPITLQGGEPMLYFGGKGLGMILTEVPHFFDLLTNFALTPEVFARNLNGQQAKLQRDAHYPSIRVSYHADEMNRTWKGRGFAELVDRCEALKNYGFNVSPVKADSDVGIYMVEHPTNGVTPEMEATFKDRVPFEGKEFLGVDEAELYGHYLYPFSIDLISRGIHKTTLKAECHTTELLLDPMGFIWGCHYFLYEGWSHGGPQQQFNKLQAENYNFTELGADLFAGSTVAPIGHILDPQFSMADLEIYRPCTHYGRCIGCDTKIKNDRFQSYYDHGTPHTSVKIRNIEMPLNLYGKIDNLERAKKFLKPVAPQNKA